MFVVNLHRPHRMRTTRAGGGSRRARPPIGGASTGGLRSSRVRQISAGVEDNTLPARYIKSYLFNFIPQARISHCPYKVTLLPIKAFSSTIENGVRRD
ncbi:hypothetical protein EVAR_75533_1 [Eumeta japonica]|uniref:Uncharacterized protein n=1 Tax=Eumeta variegata TaxID=151549 RepID=A0A4C1UIU6_EUMVA|nr:hypothetical protein EVAR_75533_1 [Eumeta japonica]